MRIDLLKTSPDRSGRYYVKLEDGSELRLYRQTIEDFGLYTGIELSEGQYGELLKAAGEMSAKMRAVRIVSAAGVSKKDLEHRLIQKGEKPADAQKAVTWLEDMQVLDDRNTASQIVHSCISKGYGLARARQSLYEKRIPRELWDDALEDYPDQHERITAFLRSKITDTKDMKTISKTVDSLIRKGHSYRVIRECLSRLSVETDEFPEEME